MAFESLQGAIDRVGNPAEFLRNRAARPFTFPIAPEVSNWRSEQRAWRASCVLFDQSHHMWDTFLNGPDALRLLASLGVNNFDGFRPSTAKQFVAVSPDGYYICDGVLFYLGPERFSLVGGQPAMHDWVRYHVESGSYDVELQQDPNSLERGGRPPRLYRYELQGPAALDIVERATGRSVPKVGFFGIGDLEIAGRPVRALRHGMAGQPGFEFFGVWSDGEVVLDAVLAAGAELGLVRAGAKAYSTANLESGWIPSPMPAIFSGQELKPFREWRDAERSGSLGGSYFSRDITSYYVTPYDLGYARLVSLDHDFVGRDALAKRAGEQHREKVTLVWDPEDVAACFRSLLGEGLPAKYLELPKARYSIFQSDTVLAGGRSVGLSLDCGYLANEQAMVSLAVLDAPVASPGSRVTVVWGEDPISQKPQVEPHRQVEIRATVAPAPIGPFARERYRARP